MIAFRIAAMSLFVFGVSSAAATSRILIVSGPGKHDTRATSSRLRTDLERSGKFEVRISEEPAGLSAAALAGYDAVVLNSLQMLSPVEAFVRAGRGAVVMHAGDTCGSRRLYQVKILDGKHPVTAGLSDSFAVSDQLMDQPAVARNSRVLAQAADKPVAWAAAEGKGRVFYSRLGHSLSSFDEAAAVALLTRAVEWAATGKVTAVAQPARPPVRALVVTGGHGYETSFYTVFDKPGIEWKHAVNHADAFARDIRDRYDVVVLYTMTNEIPEAARKNLMNFIEAGKGLVVLHHAVFSFTDWDWWREEVTGTRPMTKERRPPGPGYQHDVDLVIEGVSKHPVTDGLTPMHIVDETYATLECSPKAQVLLRTNHPTSNGPVAWLGTHPRSRVITIQLGHDHTSHLHSGFRTLVERAILWGANKL
jgi:type 1 glutamine amidotransferase